MEHDVVLADEMDKACVLILPPLLPSAPFLRLLLAELLRVTDVADGCVKPNVEHLTLSSFNGYRDSPVQVTRHSTRLQVHIQPALALAIDVGAPLFVLLQDPLLQPLLILVQGQVPVLCLLHHRRGAADGALRINEFRGREVTTALLTLVTIGALIVAVGALARYITVGQELLSLFVIQLCGGLFCQLALVIELAEPFGSKLMVGLAGSATVDIKRDAELLKRVLDHLVVTIDYVLRGDAFLTGTDGNGHTVLIASADEHHVLLLQSQVAHINVGRYIDTGQVADMNTSVGVGQCRRYRKSLVILLFHIFYFLFYIYQLVCLQRQAPLRVLLDVLHALASYLPIAFLVAYVARLEVEKGTRPQPLPVMEGSS